MKILILSVVLLWPVRATAETITVRAGANLQAALDRAKGGDTIELEAGAMFNGHFTLPVKDGTSVTTLQTAGRDLSTTTARVSPADAVKFAKLQTPDHDPALQTAPGAHHWRITLIEVFGADDGDLVALGDWHQSSPSQVPHDIVVDRVYIHGDPARGRRRGISLNSASTAITNSYISDIKQVGHDTQAIGGSTGPGPFTITNNYLEASTENLMFGGADPAIPNLVPTDITITGNTIAKPESWRKERWEVKNLFELKNARHVVVRDNTLEYNWLHGQTGFAVLFTVRNQDGGCPWCEVSDVVFERNIVRHSSAGVMILGVDYTHPSKQMHDIVIRDNVFSDIDNQRWGGSGYAFQISGGPRDITIDHNTI
ncbi:MAG TPA: right-handed parallel beta-helix repeat-containing protein, partial [Vicinamibacterales bacterium]|nr:right-handed parallel beta-helix repeat-containing protein [Vicinamibacterales bacterium]